MLSYQHGFHAGNRADVFKHAVLFALICDLADRARKLFYVETHSGRGVYDLTGAQAQKTGEAETGVLALPEGEALPVPLKDWAGMVRRAGASAYPGSPALALEAGGQTVRAALFEQHPREHSELEKALGGDPSVQIIKGDGYARALKLQPRGGEQMLVFLDPSYETVRDMEALADWLPRALRRWPKAMFVIWLPLFRDGRETDFGTYLSELGCSFVAGARWPGAATPGSALEGSAMVGFRTPEPFGAVAGTIAQACEELWRAA